MFLTLARYLRSPPPDRWWKRRYVFNNTWRFGGRHRNCYKIAIQSMQHAWRAAKRGRREKKRFVRGLWIERLRAASEEHGLSYEHLVVGLDMAQVQIDRKVLTHLAIYEPKTFKSIVEIARISYGEGLMAATGKQPEGVFTRIVHWE